jgi:hypothetical protein
MTGIAAVTEAARRLGKPDEIAREHARVRPAFGARLSTARLISILVLIVPAMIWFAQSVSNWFGWMSRSGAELGVCGVLTVALVARLSWARPVLLGTIAFFALEDVFYTAAMAALGEAPATDRLSYWLFRAAFLAWKLALIAFLAPWHRRDLTSAGASLALQAWAYAAAAFAAGFTITSTSWEKSAIAPTAEIALIAAVIATCGGVLRARWSAVAAAGSAVTLAIAAADFAHYSTRWYPAQWIAMMGIVVSGAVAAAIAAALAWRSARSNVGALRCIRS